MDRRGCHKHDAEDYYTAELARLNTLVEGQLAAVSASYHPVLRQLPQYQAEHCLLFALPFCLLAI